MTTTVRLVSDANDLQGSWVRAFDAQGVAANLASPEEWLPLNREVGVLFDASCPYYEDEDELLTAIGCAKAAGAVVGVFKLSTTISVATKDLVYDMCGGLTPQSLGDAPQVAAMLKRRLDPERHLHFEFVTVAPDGQGGNQVLAILGDGLPRVFPRPLCDEDDGTKILDIQLDQEARIATLRLESGRELELPAKRSTSSSPSSPSIFTSSDIPRTSMEVTQVGARLRALRVAAGLTQAELARRTGIHRPNIARVEAGRHTPSLDTLARLAAAIGIPTLELLA